MARPLKTVDESKIKELASKGHTVKGIAALSGISVQTLYRRFGNAYEQGKALLADAIRVKQVEAALNQNGMKGTSVDRIWAGKQFADQTERQEIDVRRQTTVRMVIGIEQSELDSLTNGYLPQQPKELPESTSDEASEPEQKGHAQCDETKRRESENANQK